MSSASNDTPSTEARLVVEAPHWASRLEIVNDRLEPVVASVGGVRWSVPPGVYRVTASLSGRSEQRWVAAPAAREARLGANEWTLRPESVAPLKRTRAFRQRHRNRAVEWSRKVTWPGAPGGGSSLFLFVRTLFPREYPRFAEGLTLLDDWGEVVTTFSEGIRKSKRDGWMAFHARLPQGYYVLHRGGAQSRAQPIYLRDGFQTQVFLPARETPSLRLLSLIMAPLTEGFRPNDDTALASEALLESVDQRLACVALATSNRVCRLAATRNNPWLLVLVAYALAQAQLISGEADPRRAALLTEVLATLRRAMPDYPDVRALLCRADGTKAVFPDPPLLRLGLAWIQEYATTRPETVPDGSLTARIGREMITNAPWTAWRQDETGSVSPAGGPTADDGATLESYGSTPEVQPSPATPRSALTTAQTRIANEIVEGPAAGLESITADPAPDDAITVEHIVGQLQSEAARLSRGMELRGDVSRARELADRMIGAAERLLRHADFSAATAPDGRVTHVNAAFASLVRQGPATHWIERRDAWEGLLRGAGDELDDPDEEGTHWERRRADDTSDSEASSIHVLRRRGAKRIAADDLEALGELSFCLTRATSLAVYGSLEASDERLDELASLVSDLEAVTER